MLLFVSDAVHTSILRPLVQRESLKFVQGPVERGVPLGPHRQRLAFGCKLVLLLLQKEREPFRNVLSTRYGAKCKVIKE